MSAAQYQAHKRNVAEAVKLVVAVCHQAADQVSNDNAASFTEVFDALLSKAVK